MKSYYRCSFSNIFCRYTASQKRGWLDQSKGVPLIVPAICTFLSQSTLKSDTCVQESHCRFSSFCLINKEMFFLFLSAEHSFIHGFATATELSHCWALLSAADVQEKEGKSAESLLFPFFLLIKTRNEYIWVILKIKDERKHFENKQQTTGDLCKTNPSQYLPKRLEDFSSFFYIRWW